MVSALARSRERKLVRLRRDLRQVYRRLSHDDQPLVSREDEVGGCRAEEDLAQQSAVGAPYMYAVSAARVQVIVRVDLHAVRDPGVDIRENATVLERFGLRIDVKRVAVGM